MQEMIKFSKENNFQCFVLWNDDTQDTYFTNLKEIKRIDDFKNTLNYIVDFLTSGTEWLEIVEIDDNLKRGLIDELNDGDYEQKTKDMILKEIL